MVVDYKRLLLRQQITNHEAITAAMGKVPEKSDAATIQRSVAPKVIRLRALVIDYFDAQGHVGPSIRHGPARALANEIHCLTLKSSPTDLFSLFVENGETLPPALLAALKAAPARAAQMDVPRPTHAKGGRPPEHDWPGCLAAMIEEFRGKLPSIKMRATEAAEDWFIKNDGGKAPDRTSIRRQITDPLYQALAQ